jgi:hypothetical protein
MELEELCEACPEAAKLMTLTVEPRVIVETIKQQAEKFVLSPVNQTRRKASYTKHPCLWMEVFGKRGRAMVDTGAEVNLM